MDSSDTVGIIIIIGRIFCGNKYKKTMINIKLLHHGRVAPWVASWPFLHHKLLSSSDSPVFVDTTPMAAFWTGEPPATPAVWNLHHWHGRQQRLIPLSLSNLSHLCIITSDPYSGQSLLSTLTSSLWLWHRPPSRNHAPHHLTKHETVVMTTYIQEALAAGIVHPSSSPIREGFEKKDFSPSLHWLSGS